MSEHQRPDRYEFGPFQVDAIRRVLRKDGVPIALTTKAFDTLMVLIEHAGETVSKTELMDRVWADTAVEENNLTQQISALRRAFGEGPREHRFIVTTAGRGYSFVAGLASRPTSPPRRWSLRLDAATRRGYALAAVYVLLVTLTLLFAPGKHAPKPRTLAILAFRTASTGDEFIGTGISDTLRARLGSVEDLVVRPAENDPTALDVDAVVSGSVQRENDHIRVAVQMVDVSTRRVIWGKTFDETESNVFALQDSIAGEVARALNVALSHNRLPRGTPKNADSAALPFRHSVLHI